MIITVLAGGVGGAKFVRGLVAHLADARPDGAGGTTDDVRVVVNTGDDMWLTGLRVCPDLDSIMYALGGANDEQRGWGRADETERVSAELTAYGVGWPWFTLGDLDLGTHIARSALLQGGLRLTEVTARLCGRWSIGPVLLPMSDDPVETLVEVDRDGRVEQIHFEEWWVRYRADLPTHRFVQSGVELAGITPEVASAIRDADVILVAPSNPVVSIGTILGVDGIRDSLAAASAPVVGVSPIIGGSPVRGMADTCLRVIGVESTAEGVARHYGAARNGGILDGWLVDIADADAAQGLERTSIATRVVPLWMTDRATSAQLARDALELALSL